VIGDEETLEDRYRYDADGKLRFIDRYDDGTVFAERVAFLWETSGYLGEQQSIDPDTGLMISRTSTARPKFVLGSRSKGSFRIRAPSRGRATGGGVVGRDARSRAEERARGASAARRGATERSSSSLPGLFLGEMGSADGCEHPGHGLIDFG
jgi:hypothetical protein